MKEENSAYIVKAKIKSRIYYLVDYDFTISMTKENAMIFTNKNIAEKISGLLERKYEKEIRCYIKRISSLSSVFQKKMVMDILHLMTKYLLLQKVGLKKKQY